MLSERLNETPKSYKKEPVVSLDMLRNRVKMLEETLDNIGSYISTKDANGRFRYANDEMLKLLGRYIGEVIGKSNDEFVGSELSTVSSSSYNTKRLVDLKKGNKVRKVESFVKPLLNKSAEAIGASNTSLEVTKLYLENKALKKLANTDPLTGLFNRRYFFKEAQALFQQAKILSKPLSVISIDIDHFKNINDQYGHSVGDSVLLAVTKLMKPNIRTEDVFARLGGEEFSIILPNTSKQKAKDIADRIRLRQDNSLIPINKQDSVEVKISVGVSSINIIDAAFEDILIRSDQALYLSKSNGRNNVHALD